MLKYDGNITSKRFSHWDDWLLFRHSLIFSGQTQLERYQEEARDQISRYYGRSFLKVRMSSQLPRSVHVENSMLLQTSGSNSTRCREYHYSHPQYEIIENHHFWRIEHEYGLEAPGPILELAYSPVYYTKDEYQESYLESHTGFNASGRHNPLTLLWFRRNTLEKSLVKSLKEGRAIKPKFVICSPSQMEFLYSRAKGIQFDCPVIMTRETLYPHVREMALQMFPRVIDKMRCWDGGLGFYECQHGRKHIYDELVFVEESDGLLVATDFFNYSTPFLRYINQDVGKIKCGMCECGVYGNYLEEFEGKIASLLKIGEYQIPGSLIVEDITSLLKFGGCSSNVFALSMLKKYNGNPFEGIDILFRVKQQADESIQFIYSSGQPLDDVHVRALEDGLNFIFYRHLGDGLDSYERERDYRTKPKPIKITEDKLLMCRTKGIRCKSLCVESEVKAI